MSISASSKCLEIFRKVINKRVSRSSPVVVAHSGGVDSTALLWLARKTFPKVTAVTVDHRLREGSEEEAALVHKRATGLGVEHAVLPMEWEAPTKRVEFHARNLRYDLLLQYCHTKTANVLLIGHHINDQLETLVYRLAWSSGIDGLKCMEHYTTWSTHRDTLMVRPLLECTKNDLCDLCKEQGLEWVEDPTNCQPITPRNIIRKVLADDEILCKDLQHFLGSFHQYNLDMQSRVKQVLTTSVHQRNGYVMMKNKSVMKEAIPVLARVLSVIDQCLSGNVERYCLSSEQINQVRESFRSKKLRASLRHSIMFHGGGTLRYREEDYIGVTMTIHRDNKHVVEPIELGKKMIFLNCWELLLTPADTTQRNIVTRSTVVHNIVTEATVVPDYLKNKKYFVRCMNTRDHLLVTAIVRKKFLPPMSVRQHLPVIVDEEGDTVAIPHLKYCNKRLGLQALVWFKPPYSLDSFNVDK